MSNLKLTPYILILAGGISYLLVSNKVEIMDEIKHLKDLYQQEHSSEETIETIVNPIVIEEDDYRVIVEEPEEIEPEEVLVEDISDELLNNGYEFLNIDLENLVATNENSLGQIVIGDTRINYPIVQGEDNEYYLHHNLEGKESSLGTIYLDSNAKSLLNPTYELSDVNVIFGHHMRGGKMFADICNFKNQKYYDDHKFGLIYTVDGYAYKLDFFGGILVSGEDGAKIYHNDFETEEEFNEYVNYIKENSYFESDVDIQYKDKIAALVTCSYENGINGNLRYVLFAKLTKQYTNELQKTNEGINVARLH